MRLVLDASAAAHVVMRTDAVLSLVETLESASIVIAPGLFHSEISNTLWKYVSAGDIDCDSALERYEEAVTLVDAFEPDHSLATEALSSAARHKHPVYDMMYAVLARRYGCSVLTMDKGLSSLLNRMDIEPVL